MAESATKHCPRCDRDLPLDEFNRDRHRPDGLTTWCRGCWRQWYLDHREETRERGYQWRQANRGRKRETSRQWRQANPERMQENGRRWRQANPERKRENDHQWRLANPGKGRESSARRRERYPLLATWGQMLNRCENPGCKTYEYYGDRGITVCEQWHDHQVFAADIIRLIGPRPKGKSLDRINNDGNYEPGNIRWATPREQLANRRPREQWKKPKKRATPARLPVRSCQQCGTSFAPRSPTAKYCSGRCNQAAYRKRRAATGTK